MEQKIRIGAVSYLNTKPMITGLENIAEIDLILDYPSRIATMLLEGTIDIGLVPVAILPQMQSYHIITDYGIACDGPVASVCLFSEVPITEIETILLDYQSKTSVQLLTILLREYWKKEVLCKETGADYENEIKGNTAGLVIGDRALELNKKYAFVYDLGEAWKKHTALPFVFAAWISNRAIDPVFETKFNAAIPSNINHYFQSAIYKNLREDQQQYLHQTIRYQRNAAANAGMKLFLQKLLKPEMKT